MTKTLKNKKVRFHFNRRIFTYIAVILGLSGLLWFFKDKFIVAWVNGRPVSRTAYIKELERFAKNQALDSLTTKQLINQEAIKNKIKINPQEINEAISQVEERAKQQGTSLDELLSAQGVKRSAVEEEIRLQKILEKLAGEVSVSQEQIQAYFDENKDLLYKNQKFADVQADISEQLRQQELINKIQSLISRLQTEAKIIKWIN